MWVTAFVLVSAGLVVQCREGRTWETGPGIKSNRPVAATLEGTWRGGDWQKLVITKVNRDSLVGRGEGGLVVQGTLVGQRADITVSGGGAYVSGYLYAIPRTDSLFVGVRDSSGRWGSFFTMHRLPSPPRKERES